MDYEVVWTEPAVEELDGIVALIVEARPAVGARLRQSVLSSVDVLQRFPFIGPRFELGWSGSTREISHKGYRIFYRVQEEAKRVQILSIRHGSRREPIDLD